MQERVVCRAKEPGILPLWHTRPICSAEWYPAMVDTNPPHNLPYCQPDAHQDDSQAERARWVEGTLHCPEPAKLIKDRAN